jgi:anti-sigma B factor antagonist
VAAGDRIGGGLGRVVVGDEEAAVPLSIAARAVYQGITQLALAGEADLATVEPLREAITYAVHREHVAGVLIDLHALRYLDFTTIGVLVEGRRLADEKGVGYRIVNPEGVVRHVLQVAGVLDYLSGDPVG